MKPLIVKRSIPLVWIGMALLFTGCETEQTNSKNNDAMVGYAKEQAKAQAKAQAEFANQEQLKKSSLPESRVVKDGTTQSLSLQQ